MASQKTQCPVCMTKMLPKGEDLVCPECGYKYCANRQPYTYDDHNHSQYQTYTRQVSYTGNPSRQAPASSQGAYSQSRQSAAQTQPGRPAAQGTSGQTQPSQAYSQSRSNAYPGTAPISSRDSYPRTQTASAQPRQSSGSSSAKKPKSPVQVIVTIFVIIFIADFVISMLAGLFSLLSVF